MATDAQNLLTRRSAVMSELAALNSTAFGGKPTYSDDGQTVDHVGYKKSLYDEIASINLQLAAIEGPYEVLGQGMV